MAEGGQMLGMAQNWATVLRKHANAQGVSWCDASSEGFDPQEKAPKSKFLAELQVQRKVDYITPHFFVSNLYQLYKKLHNIFHSTDKLFAAFNKILELPKTW
jgi:hypothetical protein